MTTKSGEMWEIRNPNSDDPDQRRASHVFDRHPPLLNEQVKIATALLYMKKKREEKERCICICMYRERMDTIRGREREINPSRLVDKHGRYNKPQRSGIVWHQIRLLKRKKVSLLDSLSDSSYLFAPIFLKPKDARR